ncbi:unnamed protein product, partial [Linum tenue]
SPHLTSPSPSFIVESPHRLKNAAAGVLLSPPPPPSISPFSLLPSPRFPPSSFAISDPSRFLAISFFSLCIDNDLVKRTTTGPHFKGTTANRSHSPPATMDDMVELILHHGGAMNMSGGVPQYVGGVVDVVNVNRDVLSYFELTKTLIEDLEYISVERLWYLTPGESMATGLHEIVSDVEVLTGLLPLVGTGDIKVYFEATRDLGELGYMGDNYGHFPEGEDASGDNSAAPEFVRLEDDDAQTSDEEYHEIRAEARRRNRRMVADLDGEGSSVNQLFAWDVNHHADFDLDSATIEGGAEAEAETDSVELDESVEFDESVEIDEGIQRGAEQVNVDEEINAEGSIDTEYRASEDSAHVRGNIAEEDGATSYDKSLCYDPKCDHNTLKFKTHMRFLDGNQFKAAVMKNAIKMGADIRWVRSSSTRKEAVCAQREEYGCMWKVYGSWFRGKEAFMVKYSGPDHICPRAIWIRAAGYKWIASEYLDVFRVNQAWNVNLIAAELKTKHNIYVSNKHVIRHGSRLEDCFMVRLLRISTRLETILAIC